jgi:glucose-6-phosphate isomerase
MLTIHWKDCGFSLRQLRAVAKKLEHRVKEFKTVVEKQSYSDDAGSLVLPTDTRHAAGGRVFANQCKDAELLVVVGIGGSNLGTVAVQEAILGKYYNLHANCRVLYADTVDPNSTHHIADEVRHTLRAGKKVVIDAVSKSGTTAETIANLEVLLDAVGKNKNVYVMVTSDVGSEFDKLAKKHAFHTLQIPKHVGGRYSVFTNVSLFPLAVMGVDIERLVEGAHGMLQHCLRTDLASNPALLLASVAYLHARKRKVQDTFVFSNDLHSYGLWYRQLLAESIGKNAKAGIIPTVSVGSTDLHSVGQLDIAGPDETFYRFVTVTEPRHHVVVPRNGAFNSLVPHLAGKDFMTIMDAILKGTQAAFRKHKRPFIEIELPDLSEDNVGGLLQAEMVATMLLGHLLGVNPFDQPAVEEYKSVTRQLLAKK